jgi:tetratricopeptide (TPR) repeat protein
MRISYYFYIFIIITLFLSFVFFPQNSELIYVYKKSGDYQKLADIYKKTLKIHYSKDIHKKYINTLFKLNSPDLIREVNIFIKKYKDINLLNKTINYALSKKNYKSYTQLLKKGYIITNNINYLQKLIDYYSYTHNRKKLIATLKESYKLSKNRKYLKILYGLGEKDYVVNTFLENIDNLSEEDIKLITTYYSDKKDYTNYQKFLTMIFEKTNDISYLIEIKNLLSFLHKQNELISVIKKLYKLTGDIKYLDTVYSLGDKKFAVQEYEKRVKTLSLKQLKQLYKYYLWDSKFEKVVKILKNYIGIDKLTPEEEKEYVGLLTFFAKDSELINFYKKKYNLTKDSKYLIKLADTYDYYGYPYKAAETYVKIFKINKNIKYLNKAISIYLALSDYDNFLKYSLVKLKKFYSETLLKQTVGLLINLNQFERAVKLTEHYIVKDNNLFHYLATLYFSINRPDKALKLFLKTPPEKLNKSELSYIANLKNINEKFFPYIVAFYKITKEKFFLNKILRYYAAKKAFYKYNRIFKKYYGKISEKNYTTYFELIDDKYKKFKINEAKRLIKTSFNIKLINNLSVFLMGLNEQKAAIKGFEKVLFFDTNNLTALEQLAKIYYWQKNFSLALRTFLKYDRVKSDNPVIKFYIGEILYNRKNYKKANEYFKYVVKHIKKNSLENKMIYLKSYVYLYGIDDILDEYRKVVKESGYDRDVYADFIDALYFSYRYDILKKEYIKFKKMGKKYTNFVRLLRLFAAAHIDMKKFKEAKILLDKALAIIKRNKAKNSTIYADYGYLYYSQNNHVKALEYYKKAYAIDRKNKEILATIKELEDFLHRNVEFSYSIKNKVKGIKATFNIPYNEKYWLGFGYNIFNNSRTEIFFKIEDIDKGVFLIEIGKRHYKIIIGNNYNFFVKDVLYTDYNESVTEDMRERKIGASINKNIGKLGLNTELSKNFYRNKHGKVASTLDFSANISYPIGRDTYLSTGFNYVKMNYYNGNKSSVFFDDYRALNLFITKNYEKDNRTLNWNFTIGTIYDLISEKYNYSGTINVKYNKNINFEYNIYYDTFSREQVDLWQFNWRIKF